MSELFGATFLQPVSNTTALLMRLKRLSLHTRTQFQEVVIAEFEDFGRALVLDNLVQSTELDEHIYHESLVHIALMTHPLPKKVLVVGGGEGATIREVLKYSCVERVVMVDIDGELVEYAKKHLEFMHKGAFNDPRVEVVIMDGREYVDGCRETFDVAVMDLTDPYGPPIARELYTAEFYSNVSKLLSEEGVMVTQAGSSFFFEEVYDSVLDAVKQVFPIVREYNVWVPAFGYTCNFIIGSKKYDPIAISLEELEKRFKERQLKMRFYTPQAHLGLLYTPIFRKSRSNP